MEILLIQPPVEDFYQTRQRIEPIGLAYLAASLIEKGFGVTIFDCQAFDKKYSIEYPTSLQYLKEFYVPGNLSPFKLFGHYYRFGLLCEEIEKCVAESKAKIFGITCMFSTYQKEALMIAEIIKNNCSDNIVVIGGVHASTCPEELLKNPSVDYVVIGEGEESFPLLAERILHGDLQKINGIDGVGYRENGKIKINPKRKWIGNLDMLPVSARGLLKTESYRIGRLKATKILASRGCPCSCSFCAVRFGMGSMLRKRSPENIISEMLECRDKFGIEAFDFEDDNLGLDKDMFTRLLDLIVENFGEGKIRLYAMNGIFPAVIDKTILEKMKKAGFKGINLTFASRREKIRRALNRPDSYDEFTSALSLASGAGLKVTAYIFLGVPGQDIEGMLDDLLFLAGKPCLIGPSIFYPVKGTPLFNEYSQKDLFDSSDFLKWRSPAFPVETEDFSRRDIFTIFYLVRLLNFMKSLDISPERLTTEEDDRKYNDSHIISEKRMTRSEAGMFLLNLFFRKKEICGIKLSKKEGNKFIYQVYKENCSKKVINSFFKKIDFF